ADVSDRLVASPVELLRERHEIAALESAHRLEERAEPGGIGVELLEHRLAAVLELVLRLAGLERGLEIAPEAIEPRVHHVGDAADVGRARLVEEGRGVERIAIARGRTVAVALEEFERDERIEEVVPAARMEPELPAQLLRGQGALAERTESSDA